MFKFIKYTLLILSILFFVTGCTRNINTTTVNSKTTNSFEQIEIKLMNEYNELYEIEEVIIGYKTNSFNPFDSRIISDSIILRNEKFNSIYSDFSKNGLEKNLLQNEFMTYTDESILGILAKFYEMKVVIVKNNISKELDYKNSNIYLTPRQKHSLYNALKNTIAYYADQLGKKKKFGIFPFSFLF